MRLQLPGGFFTEQGIVPVGPIAAIGAGGGLVSGGSGGGGDPSSSPSAFGGVAGLGTGGSMNMNPATLDFEQPPSGRHQNASNPPPSTTAPTARQAQPLHRSKDPRLPPTTRLNLPRVLVPRDRQVWCCRRRSTYSSHLSRASGK